MGKNNKQSRKPSSRPQKVTFGLEGETRRRRAYSWEPGQEPVIYTLKLKPTILKLKQQVTVLQELRQMVSGLEMELSKAEELIYGSLIAKLQENTEDILRRPK